MNLEAKTQAISKLFSVKINIDKVEDRLSQWASADKSHLIIPKQVFFSFSMASGPEESLKNGFLEQLEIAFQILINQGYTIFVFNSEDQDIDKCKNFVDVFKDQAIQYVGCTHENSSAIDLLSTSEFAIVMDEQSLVYSLIIHKPFIPLFNNKELLEEIKLQEVFIEEDKFNAGVLLRKINYLEGNKTRIQDIMAGIFDEHTEKLIRSNSDVVVNETQEVNSVMNSRDEMDLYKKQFKENIQILIEQGLLQEAKDMVQEYEKIVKGDIDIYSIKGVIAMVEGDLDGAEEIWKKGLDVQPYQSDLIYNIAYLYQMEGKHITAYKHYKKVCEFASGETASEAKNRLEELEKLEAVRNYAERKKVLFIAHIFPPVGGSGVQRSVKFVKYLRNFGWEPIVITVGKTQYPFRDETLLTDIPEEIEIIRIDEPISIDIKYANRLVEMYKGIVNDDSLIEEYVAELNKSRENLEQLIFIPDPYITWAVEALDRIADIVDFKEIALIYTTSGPYSDHVLGYYLKTRYNKPWVADFRDEWTNNPYVNYNEQHIYYKLNYAMENNIVNFADKVITVTPISSNNYENIFKLEKSKIATITNGYDELDFKPVSKKKKRNDKFTIVHNGLLYMIRTPLTFLQAVRKLIDNGLVRKDKIKVIFGWTENKRNWMQVIDTLNLRDVVEFKDYMTHEDSLAMVNQADALLLIVGPGEKNKSVYPGKVFEYLRLCKPIMALSPKNSLVEELIISTNRGYNTDYNDIDGIASCLLELYKLWEEDDIPQLIVDENIRKYERRKLTEDLGNVFLKVLVEYEIGKALLKQKELKEKDSSFYDELFQNGGWNSTYFGHYSETHYFETWSKALELIKQINDPNIIEIGCGPGQFANLLFDNDIKKYKGIDFSTEAIKQAKIRNDRYKNLFKIDNAYSTSLFDEDYNTIVIFEVLEHVEEDFKILSRIKEKTNVLVTVPNFYSDGHVRWFKSKQEIYERYKDYIIFEHIFTFNVGGDNYIYLIKGKAKG